MIQEYIVSILQKRPQDFDADIFLEMQHFLVHASEAFKKIREYRHMSRIIIILYLFRKFITKSIAKKENKRYLSLKLFKTRLYEENTSKQVLSLFIAVNFLKENEAFEERHILNQFIIIFPIHE